MIGAGATATADRYADRTGYRNKDQDNFHDFLAAQLHIRRERCTGVRPATGEYAPRVSPALVTRQELRGPNPSQHSQSPVSQGQRAFSLSSAGWKHVALIRRRAPLCAAVPGFGCTSGHSALA